VLHTFNSKVSSGGQMFDMGAAVRNNYYHR